jgi:hypothetical protein
MPDSVQDGGHTISISFPDSTKIRATAILFEKGCNDVANIVFDMRIESEAMASLGKHSRMCICDYTPVT